MRNLSTSLTTALCDQIFTQPIHWTKATDFPETATHAIDFGPGGLSGCGPMTARNLDGRGVRVIVIGDKGKSVAELFDGQRVKREEWWSKKYMPGLVKTRYVVAFDVWAMILTFCAAMAPSISILLSPAFWASPQSWSPV